MVCDIVRHDAVCVRVWYVAEMFFGLQYVCVRASPIQMFRTPIGDNAPTSRMQ